MKIVLTAEEIKLLKEISLDCYFRPSEEKKELTHILQRASLVTCHPHDGYSITRFGESILEESEK